MKSNLYREIKKLKDRLKEIERIGVYIKHDKSKADEYMKLYEEYQQITQALETIEQEFSIDAIQMQSIISNYNNKNYRLKVFRETINRDDDVYYTYRYLACYLDESNPFYNYSENERTRSLKDEKDDPYTDYAVDRSIYEEIHKSISNSESYIVSTSEEDHFYPIISPTEYLKRVNFIKSVTSSFWNNFVAYNFPHYTKFMLRRYLEEIEIDSEIYKIETATQKGE